MKLGLKKRIFLLLSLLVTVNLLVAGIAVWQARRIQAIHVNTMDHSIRALNAAQGLESSLVMQKGFATYYFLNGEEHWLRQLSEHHKAFLRWLDQARGQSYLPQGLSLLRSIESEYLQYDFERNKVLDLYRQGDRQAGAEMHWKVRDRFHRIYGLCEEYKELHQRNIAAAQEAFSGRTRLVTNVSLAAIPASALLAFVLGALLVRELLNPIHRLALGQQERRDDADDADDIVAIDARIRNLTTAVDQVQSKLDQSREHLVQSEKLALVGKLAAGVAHSIRNPLTSVKMRLFSLQRDLDLEEAQREDLEVIAEEIGHIDTILRNFLEFSRRPKLSLRRASPSDVVDMARQLLRHRFESLGVDVEIEREGRLPEADIDAEQLKEVLVNILLNACEVLPLGGLIRIVERAEAGDGGQRSVVRIQDNGPGIPAAVMDKIFEPFFSTKEEGSGLGLSIARRIVQEHGGSLEAESKPGQGAAFILTLATGEA